jgi:two-component system phosphate regulon response regulator PhoB
MAQARILIVEDDPDISEMISYNLKKEGYEVMLAPDGEKAVTMSLSSRPDLMVLDIMLPAMDGLEVLKAIKQDGKTSGIPVIMLTAKGQETDKVVGLELGADDYMTKPFSPKELVARIRAVMRRSGLPGSAKVIRAGDLEIDSSRHRAMLGDIELQLTTTEFRLLERLARNPGKVLSRQRILDEVFGYRSDTYDRTVDTHIKTLRKKLGRARDYIETVRGVGYRLREA